MKKIMFILCIGLFLISGVYAKHTLCYARKCDKCEYNVRNRVDGACRGIAERDFTVPIVEINGKKYTIYRCYHGHRYLVNIETGKAKFLEDKE